MSYGSSRTSTTSSHSPCRSSRCSPWSASWTSTGVIHVRAGAATVGSAFAAYGLRELLRAVGGGHYCCNHAFYAAVGLAVAAVGWVLLVAALQGPTLAAD